MYVDLTYDEAVEYIINIPRFNKYIDKGFKPNETLSLILSRLGNPHLGTRSIHIAGTNGKGSTVQLIKNILVSSGYKVGCFVSPHLIRINERISVWSSLDEEVEDTYISDQDFLEAFNTVKTACDSAANEGVAGLTFFEYVFAIGAVCFAKQGLDYCIYETGLGGRLDATNTLKPDITVITSIGLDHVKLLGDTIEEIAYEKAGIIKSGIPVIYNTGSQAADKVIETVAKQVNAPLIKVEKECYKVNDIVPKSIDFSCFSSYYRYHNIILNTDGIYQVQNAHTAICACNALLGGEAIPEEIIRRACRSFFWQGRMEELDAHLIIDGAHNLDAIVPFVKSVKARRGSARKVNILFAVADDKNYKDMIEYLCDNLNLAQVYVTSIESDRRVSPEHIAGIFETCLGDNSTTELIYDSDLRKTFSRAYVSAKESDDVLYCVGSLYLIGSIKEYYMEEFKDD